MECPECAKVTSLPPKMMEFEMASKCPRCGYKIRKATRTVSLSERDVARVLQAITKTEDWSIYTALTRHLARSTTAASPTTTPEGWPVPSYKLMEEIAKLL